MELAFELQHAPRKGLGPHVVHQVVNQIHLIQTDAHLSRVKPVLAALGRQARHVAVLGCHHRIEQGDVSLNGVGQLRDGVFNGPLKLLGLCDCAAFPVAQDTFPLRLAAIHHIRYARQILVGPVADQVIRNEVAQAGVEAINSLVSRLERTDFNQFVERLFATHLAR